MIVELINTGSELMLGRVLNTHQQWLCRQLADLGYLVARQVAVADTPSEIEQAVRESLARADLAAHSLPQYFPSASVRLDWLEKARKTESDHACPHGVQFYDVVVDGVRHPRAAWSYEAPLPAMKQVAGRFGFWEDVAVG